MILELSGITRHFGPTVALDDITFTIDRPGIYGFIGPNGAGKSTLLRILAGLLAPDSGDALLDGVSVIDYPERIRRRTGFMPDTLPDAADIRVGEYLDFHLRAFGCPPEERQQRFSRIAELTRLDGSMQKKRLSELSKGMKQRVSLARILLHDPELLLLDEPAAGLDPGARVELRNILLDQKQQGKTIILSSHILSELEDMVDGVIIIEKGHLIKAGRFDVPETAAVPGAGDLPEEVTFTPVDGSDSAGWCSKVAELDGVISAVVAGNGRDITVTVHERNFAVMMVALIRSGFPLSAMYRQSCRIDLEQLFLNSTSGKVQ